MIQLMGPLKLRLFLLALFMGMPSMALSSTATNPGLPPLEIVLIEATKSIGTRNYAQQGQGWVFDLSPKSDLLIITPSHVVDGAGQISFYCGAKTKVPLEVVGNSPTYDLAVLRLSKNAVLKNCRLSPLITFDNLTLAVDKTRSTKKIRAESHYRYALPSGENTVGGIIEKDLLRRTGVELTPYRADLVSDIGVRPGMSGAALVSARQSIPVGMVTKTRINDHRSLLIPLSELLSVAIDLSKGSDPWRINNQKPFIEFNYETKKSMLFRNRKLILPENHKSRRFSLTERCAFGSYQFVSSWQPQGGSLGDSGGSLGDSGGSLGDSGGSLGDSGGSLGDSGGNLVKGKSSSYTGQSQFTVMTKDMILLLYSFYLDANPCSDEGLLLPDGRVLLGIYDPTTHLALRTEDANTLLPLAIKLNEDFPHYLNQYGIFLNINDTSFDIFCRPQNIGPIGVMTTSDYLSSKTFPIMQNKAIGFSSETTAEWVPLKSEPSWFRHKTQHLSRIQCHEIKGQKNGMIEIKQVSELLSFSAYFTPKGIAGRILLPRKSRYESHQEDSVEDLFIQDEFEPLKDGHYWSHSVTTKKGIKIRFELNPSGNIFEVTFLYFPPEIRQIISSKISNYQNMPIRTLKYLGQISSKNEDQ